MAAVYDKNYGQILGGAQPQYDQNSSNYTANPQAPPSWGYIPSSMQSTLLVPQSQSGLYPYDSGVSQSQDSYPSEFAEYDPRAEKKERRQKEDKKERRRKRKAEDSKTATEWLLFLGVFNAIMWTIPIFGSGWHQRMFMGFGINFTKISTGLLSVRIDVKCHGMKWGLGLPWDKIEKMNPDQAMCRVFEQMSGTHSMQDAKDLACSVSKDSCNTMAHIWYASFLVLFAYGVSALMSMIGAIFLWFYWYQEHLAKIRRWAFAMYCTAPAFGLLCFAAYNILCPDLGELPKAWSRRVAMFTGGGLHGLGEVKAIGDDNMMNRFGWCWYLSYITFAFATAAPVSWGLWFKKHQDEEKHEIEALNEQIELEDAVEQIATKADYVSAGYLPGEIPAYDSQARGIHGVDYPQYGAGMGVGQTPYYAGQMAPNSGYSGSMAPNSGYYNGGSQQGQTYHPGHGMISY